MEWNYNLSGVVYVVVVGSIPYQNVGHDDRSDCGYTQPNAYQTSPDEKVNGWIKRNASSICMTCG